MSGKNYKAVQYEVTQVYGAITDEKEPWNSSPAYNRIEKRYRIVSTETGEILDDAQGYGYKTAQKAYAAYAYKTRDKTKDKETKEREKQIKRWLREHKSFVKAMDRAAFEIAKGSWAPNEKFTSKVVQELLNDFDLTPDFTPFEILRVWRKL